MKIEQNSYLRFATLVKERKTGFIYFDTPELPKMEPQPDDTDYVIEQQYDRRPDKIANFLYGDPDLWWIIAVRNDWEHPQFQCVVGKKIVLPSTRYVEELIG